MTQFSIYNNEPINNDPFGLSQTNAQSTPATIEPRTPHVAPNIPSPLTDRLPPPPVRTTQDVFGNTVELQDNEYGSLAEANAAATERANVGSVTDLYNTPTAQPQVPAPLESIGGLFDGLGYSEEDQAEIDFFNERDRQNAYSEFDPEGAYSNAMKQQQTRIDSINTYYSDLVNQSRVQNAPEYQARLSQARLQSGLGGYATSAAGSAQTTRTDQANEREQQAAEGLINSQRNAAMNEVYGSISNSVDKAQERFDIARKEGTTAYIAAIKGRGSEKQGLVNSAVATLLEAGIDPSNVSPEELKPILEKLGVSQEQLQTAYNTSFSEQQSLQAEEQAKQDKSTAELEKIKAETYNLSIKEQEAAFDRALDEKRITIDQYKAETDRITEGRLGSEAGKEEDIALYEFHKDEITSLLDQNFTQADIDYYAEAFAQYGTENVIYDENTPEEERKILKELLSIK